MGPTFFFFLPYFGIPHPASLPNHTLHTWPFSRTLQAKMGTFKKEKNRRDRDGSSSGGLANVKTKGENFYRYVKSELRDRVERRTNHVLYSALRRRSRP